MNKELKVANARFAHLLAESHIAAFAPAFTLSLCESEAPANRRCA